MRKIWLLTFFISFASHACFIKTHEQVLIVNKSDNYSKLVKSSDCNDETLRRFVNFAKAAQGTVSAHSFSQSFPGVTLEPSRVKFLTLEDQLSLRSILPNDGRVIEASRISGDGFISMSHDQRLDIECPTCSRAGESSVRVNIKDNFGAIQKTHWFKVTIGVPTQAFVATQTHKAGLLALDPKGFEMKTIFSAKPHQIVSSSTPLQFYKIARNLSAGEILETSNISPLQLVKPGVEAQVTVTDKNVTINGTATPLSYGVWGETIKLKNTRSSRIIMGKVVDHNKIVVEL